MALQKYIVRNDPSGLVMAQVPMALDGDATELMHNFGTASFRLALNDPTCPENWEDYVQPIQYGVIIVDENLPQPLWGGYINGMPVQSGQHEVTVNCVTYAGYLTQRYVPDVDSATKDQIDWVRFLVNRMNTDHPGMGITVEGVDSGTPRTMKYGKHEWRPYFDVINELAEMIDGFEWIMELRWKDASKNAITKTLRAVAPKVGTVVNNPDLLFSYPGNITDYDYEKSFRDGDFATHYTLTGDGSEVKQVMSTPVIDVGRESSGFPRIEVREQMSGVAYANDANSIAGVKAKGLFNPPLAVQVSLDNTVGIDEINLGDTVRVEINDAKLKINDVWRIVAISFDENGIVKPTLAPVTESQRFPLIPGDPTNATREANELVESFPVDSNPFSQGFEVLSPDGSTVYSLDPEKGFGSYDPALGPDDGWSDIGGDYGRTGYFWKGVANSGSPYIEESIMVTIEGETDPVLCPNWSGLAIRAGDEVAVSTSNPDGDYVVITRIKAGYPAFEGQRLVADSGNIMGHGADAIIGELLDGSFNIYTSSGETVHIEPAQPLNSYNESDYLGFNIFGGYLYARFKTGWYRYMSIYGTPWVKLVIMTTGDGYVGIYNQSSEIFAPPIHVEVPEVLFESHWEKYPNYTSNSGDGYYRYTVIVHRLNAETGDFDSTSQTFSTPSVVGGPPPKPIPTGISVVTNGSHLYVEVPTEADAGVEYERLVIVHRFDAMGVGSIVEPSQGFLHYMGIPDGVFDSSYSPSRTRSDFWRAFRMSEDGLVYFAGGTIDEPLSSPLRVYFRSPIDSEAGSMDVAAAGEYTASYAHVQRVGLTGMFYVSSYLQDGIGAWMPMVWKVTSSESTKVIPTQPGISSDRPINPAPVIKQPDGKILVAVMYSPAADKKAKLYTF